MDGTPVCTSHHKRVGSGDHGGDRGGPSGRGMGDGAGGGAMGVGVGAQQKKRETDADGDGMNCMLAARLRRPLRRRLGAQSDNPPPDCSRRR